VSGFIFSEQAASSSSQSSNSQNSSQSQSGGGSSSSSDSQSQSQSQTMNFKKVQVRVYCSSSESSGSQNATSSSSSSSSSSSKSSSSGEARKEFSFSKGTSVDDKDTNCDGDSYIVGFEGRADGDDFKAKIKCGKKAGMKKTIGMSQRRRFVEKRQSESNFERADENQRMLRRIGRRHRCRRIENANQNLPIQERRFERKS